jgi:hypothetical protein
VAKATKNKKSKEGRHVGLDFYDLLIEGHYAHRESARVSIKGQNALWRFINNQETQQSFSSDSVQDFVGSLGGG